MEMEFAGTRRQTGQAVRPTAPRTLPGAPSWGRVLATTVGLWTSRRLSRLRRPRPALIAAICALAVAAAAVGVVRLASTSSRVSPAASPHLSPAQPAVAAAPEQIQAQAAAWIARQVSSNATVACDPAVCTALSVSGVATTRLVPLSAGTPGASDVAAAADVIVASGPARAALGREAPGLLASFGSGDTAIDVRAAAPGGAAAYQAAVRADLAARRSGGAQLLHSKRIEVGSQGTAQLQAGQVDSRLLIMLAMLASEHPWRVVAFGGASPGVTAAQAPFRQVTIADAGGRGAAADLASALAMVRAQQGPYQPAQVSTVRLDGGQEGLTIGYDAPGPLGLLSGGASG
jgi:hypothetical protein